MNKITFSRIYTSNSRQISILGTVTSMREQTRWFHYKKTTDSYSEYGYVANYVDFNVMRVIIIVIVIKVIVIKIVYISKKSNNSNSYSNNGNKIVIIVKTVIIMIVIIVIIRVISIVIRVL